MVLNDWLCDTSTWDPALPYLSLDLCTWAFVDLRGYGRSRGLSGAFTVEEAAADVIAAADSLGWERFVLIGHSMSTIVALHLAQRRSERIERVVLVCPPPPRGFGYDDATFAALREVALGDDTRRLRAVEAMLGGRLSAGWSRFKVDRWRATSDPSAVEGYLSMFGVRGLPDLETPLACPVLAVAGEEDAPPMRSDAVTQSLSGLCPDLAVVALRDSGHYPMQETPPRLVAVVEGFVAGAR